MTRAELHLRRHATLRAQSNACDVVRLLARLSSQKLRGFKPKFSPMRPARRFRGPRTKVHGIGLGAGTRDSGATRRGLPLTLRVWRKSRCLDSPGLQLPEVCGFRACVVGVCSMVPPFPT